MNLLFLGDIHWRSVNPRGRIDNYQEALAAKLRECFTIAREEDCAAILQAGDVFDSPSVAWGTVTDLVEILQEAPCPIYCAVGNHDVYGGLDSLQRTPLWMLHRAGLVSILDHGEAARVPDYECANASNDALVSVRHYTHDIDLNPEQDYSPQHNEVGGVRIHIVHGMLTPRPLPDGVRCTVLGAVTSTADLVLTGHYHLPVGPWTDAQGTTWTNPGALCRLTASVEEIDRPVQVALIHVQDGKATVQLRPLSSARPGSDVLSREHIETAQRREENRDRFLQLLQAEGITALQDAETLLQGIAAAGGVPQEVTTDALGRLAAARVG